MNLSPEAQEIIYACRDGIEMLVGSKPEQETVQELVSAGLLRAMGNDVYYVVEFEA